MPKPDMALILGIGGKRPKSEPPPRFGKSPEPAVAEEEKEPSSGMCSVMCPKCGEAIPVEVKAAEAVAEPEADEMGDEMGAPE